MPKFKIEIEIDIPRSEMNDVDLQDMKTWIEDAYITDNGVRNGNQFFYYDLNDFSPKVKVSKI